MPTVSLPDRSVVSISGPDAEHLLQNLITTDLDALKQGEAKPGALLTPQGKIMFDFLISRHGADGFLIDIRSDASDDFLRRMMMYKLRAKAEIAKQDQMVVGASWGNDSTGSNSESSASGSESTRVNDTRFRLEPVTRTYTIANSGSESAAASPDVYTSLRIANAVAESGPDYPLSDAFPHDVLLEQLDGVGFGKGCFVGQEVVSRMKHRGTARRRVLIVKGEAALPASGTDLTVDGKIVGTLGAAAGPDGLAIARIDKVKAAMDAGQPILAGDTPVSLTIPSWATFTFPADTAEES